MYTFDTRDACIACAVAHGCGSNNECAVEGFHLRGSRKRKAELR
jgi:hypothetical protein